MGNSSCKACEADKSVLFEIDSECAHLVVCLEAYLPFKGLKGTLQEEYIKQFMIEKIMSHITLEVMKGDADVN